jgi:hypothetical protein
MSTIAFEKMEADVLKVPTNSGGFTAQMQQFDPQSDEAEAAVDLSQFREANRKYQPHWKSEILCCSTTWRSRNSSWISTGPGHSEFKEYPTMVPTD